MLKFCTQIFQMNKACIIRKVLKECKLTNTRSIKFTNVDNTIVYFVKYIYKYIAY